MAILHGRLPAEEKEKVTLAFADGVVDVLITTTVIEVGVDVPNAVVMVVMDADRFGVSELHQLRGRVGRGADPRVVSWRPRHRKRPLREIGSTPSQGRSTGSCCRGSTWSSAGREMSSAPSRPGESSLKLLQLRRDADLIEQALGEAIKLVDADPAPAGEPRARRGRRGH